MLTFGHPSYKGSYFIRDHASVVLCIIIIKRDLFWTQDVSLIFIPNFDLFWSYSGIYFQVEIYDRIFLFFFLIEAYFLCMCSEHRCHFWMQKFGNVQRASDLFNCLENRKVYGRAYCTYHVWFSFLHSLLETIFAPISIPHVILESRTHVFMCNTLYFCLILTKSGTCWLFFKPTIIRFHENPFSVYRVSTCTEREGGGGERLTSSAEMRRRL
jgi:hypothetical protein